MRPNTRLSLSKLRPQTRFGVLLAAGLATLTLCMALPWGDGPVRSTKPAKAAAGRFASEVRLDLNVHDPVALALAELLRRLADERLLSSADSVRALFGAKPADMGIGHARSAELTAKLEELQAKWPSEVWDAPQVDALAGTRISWSKTLAVRDPQNRTQYRLEMTPAEVGRCLRVEPIARAFQGEFVEGGGWLHNTSFHGPAPSRNLTPWTYRKAADEREWELKVISLRPQNCVASIVLTQTEPTAPSDVSAATRLVLDVLGALRVVRKPEWPREVEALLLLERSHPGGASTQSGYYYSRRPWLAMGRAYWNTRQVDSATSLSELVLERVSTGPRDYCLSPAMLAQEFHAALGMEPAADCPAPTSYTTKKDQAVCFKGRGADASIEWHARFETDGPSTCTRSATFRWTYPTPSQRHGVRR